MLLWVLPAASNNFLGDQLLVFACANKAKETHSIIMF